MGLDSTVAEADLIPENIFKRMSKVSFDRDVLRYPGVDNPDR